jgi:thioredoxin 1
VFTLNVDEELEAAQRFNVRAIPATLLFVDGRERARLVGFYDRNALRQLIRSGPLPDREKDQDDPE